VRALAESVLAQRLLLVPDAVGAVRADSVRDALARAAISEGHSVDAYSGAGGEKLPRPPEQAAKRGRAHLNGEHVDDSPSLRAPIARRGKKLPAIRPLVRIRSKLAVRTRAQAAGRSASRAFRSIRWAAMLLAVVLIAGCGSTAPTAYSVINSYLNALEVGDYSKACGLLDHSARASLRGPCRAVFARCLANDTAAIARDQTQQLYANVNLTTTGDRAVAQVSGTAVARTVKNVTVAEEHGNWRLTSPGRAFRRGRQ
jgi:hypothetical protein